MTYRSASTSPTALPLPPVADAALRRELRERLLSLNFHAFARCMALLLEQMGYQDVRLSGRTGWKGKNRSGGYDLEADLTGGLGTRRVLVQLKQFDTQAVFVRGLDELRGVCLRVGASEALLVTTGQFAPSVERAAFRLFEPPVAPVRLLDGDALTAEMIRHRVGVWEEPGGTADEPCVLGIDAAFFDDLERNHSGNRREDYCARPTADSRFLVTVRRLTDRSPKRVRMESANRRSR